MKKKFLTNSLPIVIIFLLGFLLRSYNYHLNFNFSPELGDNLLEMKNNVSLGIIPLVGPPTSHPWLYFGPLYYWILTPLLILFRWNPLTAGYFGIGVGSLLIFINYYFVRKIFEYKTTLISSFLIAISPLWINFSQDARFYFMVTLFFYPFYYYLFKYKKKEDGALIICLLFLGIMLNFHLSPLIFIPIILYLIIKNKEKPTTIIKAIFVFIMTQLPFLIFDAKNAFFMTRNLILWIPYRIAGFTFIYTKNNPTYVGTLQSVKAITETVGKTFFYNERYWIIVVVIFLLMYLINLRKKRDLLSESLLIIAIVALIIHGDAPTHYLLPVFPVVLIMASRNLSRLSWKALISVLLFVFIINFGSYFVKKSNYIDFQSQNTITDIVIADARKAKYSLKRIGPYDYFKDCFAQNYQYLLWWKGNEPTLDSKLTYIISEIPRTKDKDEVVIYTKDNLIVTRKTKAK